MQIQKSTKTKLPKNKHILCFDKFDTYITLTDVHTSMHGISLSYVSVTVKLYVAYRVWLKSHVLSLGKSIHHQSVSRQFGDTWLSELSDLCGKRPLSSFTPILFLEGRSITEDDGMFVWFVRTSVWWCCTTHLDFFMFFKSTVSKSF